MGWTDPSIPLIDVSLNCSIVDLSFCTDCLNQLSKVLGRRWHSSLYRCGPPFTLLLYSPHSRRSFRIRVTLSTDTTIHLIISRPHSTHGICELTSVNCMIFPHAVERALRLFGLRTTTDRSVFRVTFPPSCVMHMHTPLASTTTLCHVRILNTLPD